MLLDWNDSTAHIIMAFYLTSGECLYVLCYHFPWDPWKAFHDFVLYSVNEKTNLQIKDRGFLTTCHVFQQSFIFFFILFDLFLYLTFFCFVFFLFLLACLFICFVLKAAAAVGQTWHFFNKKDLWELSDLDMWRNHCCFGWFPLKTEKCCFIKYFPVITSV